MKLKTILYTLLTIAFISFIAYRISKNKAKNEDPKDKGGKSKSMMVNGMIVKPETFENNLSLSGSLEANEQVEIRSEVSGIVEAIYFTEGSFVTKGQLLFKVNDIELRAQLKQATTKQELASENERRAKLLLQKEAISQEEYEVARADFRSSQAQSQLIRAQIAKTAVRAPFSGKIGLRSISPGIYITPAILVAKLVDTNQLKITFSIPEKYASQIKVNTPLNYTVAGTTNQFVATISAIEPEISEATRTLKIRAITKNKEGKLFPGTYANVLLPLDRIQNAIVVPSEAIIPIQNGKKVFVYNHGLAKEVMVETATRTDAAIVVLSGLKAGDTLVTSGVMALKKDAPINIKLKM